MTSTIVLPDLNTSLLSDLLTWAYAEKEDARDLFGRLVESSPHHDQGTWFSIDGLDLNAALTVEDEERFVDDVTSGVCGTRACIAGNAVFQAKGWVLDVMFIDFTKDVGDPGRHPHAWRASSDWAYPVRYTGVKQGKLDVYVLDTERQHRPVSSLATELLGLTEEESSAMFSGENSLGDLWWLAQSFASARGVALTVAPAVAEALDDEYQLQRWDTDGSRYWPVCYDD